MAPDGHGRGSRDGTLALDGGPATLDVREARLLLTKHTIVGASTILGSPGLFTFVKPRGGPAVHAIG